MQLEKTNHPGLAVMWSHKLGTYTAHMGFTHHKAPREHTRKAAVFYVHKYIRRFVGVLDVTQGSFDISTTHHHTWAAKDKLLYYFCTAPWQVIFHIWAAKDKLLYYYRTAPWPHLHKLYYVKNAEIFQNILVSKSKFRGRKMKNLVELSKGTGKGSSLDPSSATILSQSLVGIVIRLWLMTLWKTLYVHVV